MRYRNLELFNVAEIIEKDGGVELCRFPRAVIDRLAVPEFDEAGNETRIYTGHREEARANAGVEVRFSCTGEETSIFLASENPFEVVAYLGDFLISHTRCERGMSEIKAKRHFSMHGVKASSINRFGLDLWRFFITGHSPVVLHGVKADAPVVFPAPSEVPRMRMLAYGSSITFAAGTPYGTLTYVNTAANLLGIDIMNKGIPGGCFCEREVLYYILGEKFDCAYFELGTNIANRPQSIQEERVGRFIDGICSAMPDKRMFFMTPVKGLSDVSTSYPEYVEHFRRSESVIRTFAGKHPNAVILDGHALLDKDYYLMADILHPSDIGNVMMGINLTRMLREFIP